MRAPPPHKILVTEATKVEHLSLTLLVLAMCPVLWWPPFP